MTQKVFSVIDNFLSYKNNKTRRKGAFPQTTEEEKLEGKVGSCTEEVSFAVLSADSGILVQILPCSATDNV